MAAGRRDPGDFEEEIRAHLALEEDDLRATGLDADEARRRARATFGRAASARERLHDASRFSGLSTILQDLRYGIRLLRRRPAFSIAAAIVLSLGIGASTALFSVVNGLFHRPLGVREPERFFYFYTQIPSGYVQPFWGARTREFFISESKDLADYTSHVVWRGLRLTVDQETQLVAAGVVESNFFSTVGVGTVLGRAFRSEDDDPTNLDRSMVISHELWLKRFAGAVDVIGRSVHLGSDGVAKEYRVVGVAAPGFRGLTDAMTPLQCWVTGAQTLDMVRGSGIGNYGNGPVGRLKPGVTLDQMRRFLAARTPVIQAELFDRLPAATRAANPDWPKRTSYQVHGILDVQIPRDPRAWLIEPKVLVAVGAVAAMVFVIATANIAGLLVVQGIGRSSEIAVRRALGAGGARLASQILTETTVLALGGGLLGTVVATLCVSAFRALAPSALVAETAVDWRVLAFAVAISIATGLFTGAMPALQALRVSVLESIGAGVVGSRRAGASIGRWVLVPQVAIACVLVLVALVHIRAIAVLTLRDPGFLPARTQVVTVVRTEPRPLPRFDLNPDPNTYRRQNADWWTRTWRFNYDLVSKLEDVAGIQAFGLTSDLPVAQRHNVVVLASQDSNLLPQDGKVSAVTQVVSDGYFDAVGTRLIAGRRFGSADVSNSVPVAIVSDALARALWPEGTPLGKRIGEPADPGRDIVWREVVGVVAEIDPIFKPKGQEPRIYKPLSQSVPLATLTVVIRTAADQPELRPDVRAAILGTDSTAEISRVRTMSQVLDEYLYPRRLAAAILLAAGGVGLVLAAVGLYGVVAYSAAQRLRELGIRATLGASPGDLIKLLIREAAMVSGGGVALGLALAYGALRLSASMYPDLPSLDVLSFVVAPTVLGLVVLAACLIPARHVVASAPARALRSE